MSQPSPGGGHPLLDRGKKDGKGGEERGEGFSHFRTAARELNQRTHACVCQTLKRKPGRKLKGSGGYFPGVRTKKKTPAWRIPKSNEPELYLRQVLGE